MDEFELGRTTPAGTESSRRLSDHHLYHLNKLFRISRKYHARVFLSNLKSHVLRALIITAQRKPAPSASLYPPEETIQFQFLSMCASKIQAVFRGYVTRKYYLMASKRLKQFQSIMSAVVAGWKTRRIMRCAKMQEAMVVIQTKRKEVSKQQQTIETSPNTYSRKKLEYLLKSLNEEIRLLIHRFHQFYNSDAWVFEPKTNFTSTLKAAKTKKGVPSGAPEIANQQASVDLKTEEQVVRPKRVRQMRDRTRKPFRAQQKEQEGQSSSQKIETLSIQRQESSLKIEKPQEMRMNIQDSLEDRPIKAKGSYQLEEADAGGLLLPPKIKEQATTNESGPPQNDPNNSEVTTVKNKSKANDKARLDKRQKYDPRKAILQEKKKKELKKTELGGDPQPTLGENVKVEAQRATQEKDHKVQPKKQTAKDQKAESNVEFIGEGSSIGRATVAYGRGNKGRAEPKIDCWANRKTNKSKAPDENRSTYRAIHSKDQKIISKSIDQIKQELLTENKPQRTKPHRLETVQQQSNILNQRLRDEGGLNRGRNQSYINLGREKAAELRKAESFPEMRTGKYVEPKKTEAVEREGHKYIDQIEAVYSNQYQSRMQKLLPKLTLLSAARQRESGGQIPVLSQSHSYVRRMISDNTSNNRFWLIASRIEKTFKDFDKV